MGHAINLISVNAKAVREARKRLKWSQNDLSASCGMSQPAISRIEQGTHPGLTYSQAHKIAKALELQLDQIYNKSLANVLLDTSMQCISIQRWHDIGRILLDWHRDMHKLIVGFNASSIVYWNSPTVGYVWSNGPLSHESVPLGHRFEMGDHNLDSNLKILSQRRISSPNSFFCRAPKSEKLEPYVIDVFRGTMALGVGFAYEPKGEYLDLVKNNMKMSAEIFYRAVNKAEYMHRLTMNSDTIEDQVKSHGEILKRLERMMERAGFLDDSSQLAIDRPKYSLAKVGI